MKTRTLTAIATCLLALSACTSINAQQVDVYTQLNINTQQPYDWLKDVPSSVTNMPTYTPDWSFIERMQNRANRQYQNENGEGDAPSLVSTYHTYSVWNVDKHSWIESEAMTNPIYMSFLTHGIKFSSPGAPSMFMTYVKPDTSIDNGEFSSTKSIFWDDRQAEWCKVTMLHRKNEKYDYMFIQRFNKDGQEYVRFGYLLDN